MELSQDTKELLQAHEMAMLTDFIDYDEVDFYKRNTNLEYDKIFSIIEKYDGCNLNNIENTLLIKLKKHL